MQRGSVEAIFRALNEAGVRYLVAGGLAVIAHGYVRYTADVDLILDLEEENVRRALAAFAGLGYRPLVPVALEQFADAATRGQWVREKGLTVFSLFSPQHGQTAIDLFVEAPLDFSRAYAAALRKELAPGLEATFISYQDLVHLKNLARRPKDLVDLERLDSLRREPPNG